MNLKVREKRVAIRQHKEPRGSEVPIQQWLEQIGATDIRYVGNRNEPPDFEITFAEERVAVEVARLLPATGWDKTTETAFENELRQLIEEIGKDPNNPRWHSWCQYDSRDRCPSRSKSKAWKERARQALRTAGAGGEFQLLEPEKLNGRGIVLELQPAGNQGSFGGVSEDEGYMIERTALDQLLSWIDKKSCKVRKIERLSGSRLWWLVFDDEIIVAPARNLKESQKTIGSAVRDQIDKRLWNKVVLVSRFQLEKPPPIQPKWFWPLWENSQFSRLPDSPR